MKTWVVRFAALYVFDVVVLLLIGLLMPSVRVGWAALWAAVILTASTIWLKPVIAKAFAKAAEKSAGSRTRAGQKVVQFGAVLLVELIVWVLVVLFSGVRVGGFLWGWVVPPVLLLLAWIVYDALDDRLQRTAGDLYDRATGGRGSTPSATSTASADSVTGASATETSRPAFDDGLTPEQRRMLDELG